MEFDVVIVGAGPAGLAAAIRLKQVSPEISVVVVEKGSEVGAHILSGAVIDPSALDRLLPEWRGDADRPLKTKVTDDRFMWLTETGRGPLPASLRAAADEQSRLLHRLARPASANISRRRPRRSASKSIRASRRRKCCTARTAKCKASPPATWASARAASTMRATPAAWSCARNTRCSPKARAAT